MHIRQATLQDLKEIMCTTELAFENELTSDNQEHTLVEELMRSDSYIPELTLVATIDNKIVGHIMYSKIKIDVYDGFAMAPLSVHPDYQKQGIGRKMMEAAEQWAKENNIYTMRLNSGLSRKEAHQFYQAHGFDEKKEQLRLVKYL